MKTTKRTFIRELYETKCYDVIELDNNKIFSYTVGNETDLYIDTTDYTIHYKNEDIIPEDELNSLKWINQNELISLLEKELKEEFDEDIYNLDVWELIDFLNDNNELLKSIKGELNSLKDTYEVWEGFERYDISNKLKLYTIDGYDGYDGFHELDVTLSDLKELDYKDHSDFNRSRGVLYKYTEEENILVVWAWYQGIFDALHYVPSSIKTFDDAMEYLRK